VPGLPKSTNIEPFGKNGSIAKFTKYLTIQPKCQHWQNGQIAIYPSYSS
jgi:hypothetical protein